MSPPSYMEKQFVDFKQTIKQTQTQGRGGPGPISEPGFRLVFLSFKSLSFKTTFNHESHEILGGAS